MVDEPREIDEIASPGVLNIPRQGEGVELLGEVLVDGIDRKPRPPEAQPLDDRVGEAGLERADDDVGRADVDLETDELGAREPRDDDKTDAATWWSLQCGWRRRHLVAEVVGEIDPKARREEFGRRIDRGVDLDRKSVV